MSSFIDKDFGEVVIRRSAWSTRAKFSVATSGKLTVTVPSGTSDFLAKRFLNSMRAEIKAKLPIKDPSTQRARDAQKKILTKKARDYLPYRLEFWATKYGYKYSGIHLSHANTRWGSRSQSGTISLNIGLMKVPEPLRDYVIIHELAHINHMDHSAAFWREVGEHDPLYKRHREQLKNFSPGL
jgi:predicted metal-dependent hydrolase